MASTAYRSNTFESNAEDLNGITEVPVLHDPEKASLSGVKPPKPAPISMKLRFYRILQYMLNAFLAIVIILIMIFTLAKYNSTKDVAGAWPPNAILSPTFLMLFVSVINVIIDVVDLLFQCCAPRVVTTVNKVIGEARKYTAFLAAIAAGFSMFAKNATGEKDLWGWSCSDAADAMASVNMSGTICNTNQAAWDLQILQIVFQVLSVIVPLYAKWMLSKNPAQKGMADEGKDEKKKKDTKADKLIKESMKMMENISGDM